MNKEIYAKELPNGIRVVFLPTRKFKTVSLGFFIHQELREDLASSHALLGEVLRRGSRRFPDNIAVRRELERLYGAELATDVLKKGERHLLSFSLSMVHDQYGPEIPDLFHRGMALLGSLVAEPLQEGEGFKPDYLDQEKEQLEREIRGLINDKTLYAMQRCLSTMCAGERFGIYKLGELEGLATVTPVSLWRYYQEVLSSNPLELYVVGEVEPERVFDTAERVFSFDRRPREEPLPATVVNKAVEEVKFKQEELPVNQAKLILGYRTNIRPGERLFYPLLVYNGVLGGFPHSKLFLNVRERASLAYYVHSRIERHKGIMVISSGIEGANYEQARGIIEEQVRAIARGEISRQEMENTRRGLINQLRTGEDNPFQKINLMLDQAIGGQGENTEEMVEKINEVTAGQVAEVAAGIQLDTVYLLQGREGGSSS
ncbi:MAG: insulinase family protein [Firmicutes bacterium]|nr:insulinase family protein [Bacillota bacterium]